MGSKGGSGKTLLSHVICYGLGVCGVQAYHFTTDQGRQVLSKDGRYYAVADGRGPGKLDRALALLAAREGIAVIDGCANRPEADAALVRMADVALVPFLPSAEDLRVARDDLQRFPAALGVPMRWPTNLWQREHADRLLAKYLAKERQRLLDPVAAKNALTTLMGEDPPDPRINAACRTIATEVLRQAGFAIELPEQ